jgi:hypothetical protein
MARQYSAAGTLAAVYETRYCLLFSLSRAHRFHCLFNFLIARFRIARHFAFMKIKWSMKLRTVVTKFYMVKIRLLIPLFRMK